MSTVSVISATVAAASADGDDDVSDITQSYNKTIIAFIFFMFIIYCCFNVKCHYINGKNVALLNCFFFTLMRVCTLSGLTR